jgi:hypothetical protein
VLEGIFHEKRHAKEKREPADPCEEFRAHELLPINRRLGWFHGLSKTRCDKFLRD